MYIYVYTYVYIYMYIYVYIYMYMYVYIYMYIHMYINELYIYTASVYVCIYISMHVYLYMYVCVHVYIYMDILCTCHMILFSCFFSLISALKCKVGFFKEKQLKGLDRKCTSSSLRHNTYLLGLLS